LAGKGVKNTIKLPIYANQLALRTRHVDDSPAFIDKSTVVIYNDVSKSRQ
jgi:hypothetical protein